jgi:integrase
MALIEGLPKIKSARCWMFTIKGEVPVSNLAKRKRRLQHLMLTELRKGNPDASEPARWRLHDLRHTLKTWMQKTRVPKDVRNAVQNHYDDDMDELYGHYSFEKEKRDALEAWARHIEGLLGGEGVAQVVLMVGRRKRA